MEHGILVDRIGIDKAGNEVHYIEAALNSNKTKPTSADVGGQIVGGSFVIETDTGKVFFFDTVENDWIEQFSFQS